MPISEKGYTRQYHGSVKKHCKGTFYFGWNCFNRMIDNLKVKDIVSIISDFTHLLSSL